MQVSDFDFELPEELIAQHPLADRSASRLLCLDAQGDLSDREFVDIPDFLRAGDVMVFNDTRVLKARLFGKKDSGGRVEILVERILGEKSALAWVRASHSPKAGSVIHLPEGVQVRVGTRQGEFYLLEFSAPVAAVLEQCGKIPLPPYISREAGEADLARYQTVYAKTPGAVAAPTAGLHFDSQLLTKIGQIGVEIAHVTLHVGAGTFQPIRVDNIGEHRMHAEIFSVPLETVQKIARARENGGRVIAVGTTTLRALESAAAGGELQATTGDTSIFITPGYRFRTADMLITNFHLPKSTLFMLVSAFAGLEEMKKAYHHAVEQKYRFFSYGDAMLLERKQS